MKLADSWVEDVPTATALEGFHDEVEEVDELDEPKDGVGGVVAAVRINEGEDQQQNAA